VEWWTLREGYDVANIGDRMVTGDFDGDGQEDSAVFYDNGSGGRIDVFSSTGDSFASPANWWSVSSGYSLEAVAGRMVAGNFNGDGRDDVAVFYDYGAGGRIHVWLSTGSSFTYQTSSGWWGTESGYALESVADRMVAGNFDGDGRDDVAVFYDYGAGGRIHVWLSTGSSFTYQTNSGWWASTDYALESVGDRMVAGDFDGNGRDDVAVLYRELAVVQGNHLVPCAGVRPGTGRRSDGGRGLQRRR